MGEVIRSSIVPCFSLFCVKPHRDSGHDEEPDDDQVLKKWSYYVLVHVENRRERSVILSLYHGSERELQKLRQESVEEVSGDDQENSHNHVGNR